MEIIRTAREARSTQLIQSLKTGEQEQRNGKQTKSHKGSESASASGEMEAKYIP